MKSRWYVAYGLLIVSLWGWAEYRGWSPLPTRERRGAPQSLRENPGSYRPHYAGGGRVRYGK